MAPNFSDADKLRSFLIEKESELEATLQGLEAAKENLEIELDALVDTALRKILQHKSCMLKRLKETAQISRHFLQHQQFRVRSLLYPNCWTSDGEKSLLSELNCDDQLLEKIQVQNADLDQNFNDVVVKSLRFDDHNELIAFSMSNVDPIASYPGRPLRATQIKLFVEETHQSLIKINLSSRFPNADSSFQQWTNVEVTICKDAVELMSVTLLELFNKGFASFQTDNAIEILIVPNDAHDWCGDVLIHVTDGRHHVVSSPALVFLGLDHVKVTEYQTDSNVKIAEEKQVDESIPLCWDDPNYTKLAEARDIRKAGGVDLSVSRLRHLNTLRMPKGQKSVLPQSVASFKNVTYITDVSNNKIHKFKDTDFVGYFPNDEATFKHPRYISVATYIQDFDENYSADEEEIAKVIILDNLGIHIFLDSTNRKYQSWILLENEGFKFRGLAVNTTHNSHVYTTEKVDGEGVYLVKIDITSNTSCPNVEKILIKPTSESLDAMESSSCKYLTFSAAKGFFITDMNRSCFYIYDIYDQSFTTVNISTSNSGLQGIAADVVGNVVVVDNGEKFVKLHFFNKSSDLLRSVITPDKILKIGGIALSGTSLYVTDPVSGAVQIYALDRISNRDEHEQSRLESELGL